MPRQTERIVGRRYVHLPRVRRPCQACHRPIIQGGVELVGINEWQKTERYFIWHFHRHCASEQGHWDCATHAHCQTLSGVKCLTVRD